RLMAADGRNPALRRGECCVGHRSAVDTTYSSYSDVVHPQVVFAEPAPWSVREVIACSARTARTRTAGSWTVGLGTTVPRSAVGGRVPRAGAGSPPRRR